MLHHLQCSIAHCFMWQTFYPS